MTCTLTELHRNVFLVCFDLQKTFQCSLVEIVYYQFFLTKQTQYWFLAYSLRFWVGDESEEILELWFLTKNRLRGCFRVRNEQMLEETVLKFKS